jgi:hypothetical protein
MRRDALPAAARPGARRPLGARDVQRGVEQADAALLCFQWIGFAACHAPPEFTARQHHGGRQHHVMGEVRLVEPVARHGVRHHARQRVAGEPQRQAAVADAPRKAEPVGLAGGDQQCMARRGDRVAARPVVLREHAGQRQREHVEIRGLDLAAGARIRAHRDMTDLQPIAVEQRAPHEPGLQVARHQAASERLPAACGNASRNSAVICGSCACAARRPASNR